MKSPFQFLSVICQLCKPAFSLLLLIACHFLFVPFASAEEDAISLQEIVVTAARIDETVDESTSKVIVIKNEDIQKMNVPFVTDILRKIPEINVLQNGGEGKVATALLRGGDSTQTLVMIDGIRVNSPNTGSFDFSGIGVNDIERIEIVEGPQSTAYGSEAMAGVINIITKKGGGKPRAELSFKGGSFGTYSPSFTVSGGDKKLDYRMTGTYFYTDGISAAKNGRERDGYRNGSVSGKLGIRPSEQFELELSGNYYYDRTALDGFDFTKLRAIDDPNFVQHDHNYLLSAKGTLYLLPFWEQILTVSSLRNSLRLRDPDDVFNNADIIGRINTTGWQHNFYISDSYILTAGAEYREEKGENKGNFDKSLNNTALYLNNKLKLFKDDLILNAGLRYDDHETFGNETTYRIGAVYNIKPLLLKIRGSYGTGFRAPALNELFFPFFGNPHLKPEESTSWELGFEKGIIQNKVSLSVTYFNQEYKNLIQTDPLTFTAANIAEAEIRGLELAALAKVTDEVSINAGYTYLDAKDESTGQRLTRRPENKVTLSGEYACKYGNVVVDYLYVGKRFYSSVKRDLTAYYVVNVSGSYNIKKWLTLFTRIDNLFDEDYEETGSYGTPGFSVYGGIKVSI